MRFLFNRLILAIMLMISLAGCGQKGDLYLPEPDADKTKQR